jgi:hypothetical protein
MCDQCRQLLDHYLKALETQENAKKALQAETDLTIPTDKQKMQTIQKARQTAEAAGVALENHLDEHYRRILDRPPASHFGHSK